MQAPPTQAIFLIMRWRPLNFIYIYVYFHSLYQCVCACAVLTQLKAPNPDSHNFESFYPNGHSRFQLKVYYENCPSYELSNMECRSEPWYGRIFDSKYRERINRKSIFRGIFRRSISIKHHAVVICDFFGEKYRNYASGCAF